MWATSVDFQKPPKENNRPLGRIFAQSGRPDRAADLFLQ
jgi:hypothetical protein